MALKPGLDNGFHTTKCLRMIQIAGIIGIYTLIFLLFIKFVCHRSPWETSAITSVNTSNK